MRMPALGTRLIKQFTKERMKKGGMFAVGFALGYMTHAAGLF
jgi:hypothetical protein